MTDKIGSFFSRGMGYAVSKANFSSNLNNLLETYKIVKVDVLAAYKKSRNNFIEALEE